MLQTLHGLPSAHAVFETWNATNTACALGRPCCPCLHYRWQCTFHSWPFDALWWASHNTSYPATCRWCDLKNVQDHFATFLHFHHLLSMPSLAMMPFRTFIASSTLFSCTITVLDTHWSWKDFIISKTVSPSEIKLSPDFSCIGSEELWETCLIVCIFSENK